MTPVRKTARVTPLRTVDGTVKRKARTKSRNGKVVVKVPKVDPRVMKAAKEAAKAKGDAVVIKPVSSTCVKIVNRRTK